MISFKICPFKEEFTIKQQDDLFVIDVVNPTYPLESFISVVVPTFYKLGLTIIPIRNVKNCVTSHFFPVKTLDTIYDLLSKKSTIITDLRITYSLVKS